MNLTHLLFGSVTYKPQKLHLQPNMNRHISHFFSTVYCGAVGYLVRKISLMLYLTTWKNQEKEDKVVTWSWDEPRCCFFFLTALPPVQMHTLCSDVLAVSMNEQLNRNRKKAFRFATSYTSETPETQAGAQLFLVGLNFRSANTRGSTAHLLVMTVLVSMNISQGPRWPNE